MPTPPEPRGVNVSKRSLALIAALLLGASLGSGGASAGSTLQPITVFAAASLTDVFPAIDRHETYSFAAANTAIPAALYAAGLVEKPVAFTRNTLVLVVPRSNPAGIHSVYDLENPGVTVDVAAPQVPVGAYTLQVLKQMGIEQQVLANVASEETDVRSVLAKVQLGQADAGFVYATDAKTVAGDVTVLKVPAWAQPKVTYAMAVVTRSRNQAAAKAFVAKVLSKAGQRVLARYGFLPLPQPVPGKPAMVGAADT